MEYLFVAVIVYFVLQAASNIVLMVRGDRSGAARRNGAVEEPNHDWSGPAPREHTGRDRSSPTFWNDVEDATWQDVSDG